MPRPDTSSARSRIAEGATEPETNVVPSQAEYEAIRQALMETARGRWFLDEFARTNRNADTATVLAAVARLEQALIDKAAAPPQTVVEVNSRPNDTDRQGNNRSDTESTAFFEALKNIEGTIAGRDQLLGPIERNLQKLQDMIWALREGGADGRVCNLLASQTQTVTENVAAMEASMATIASAITDLSNRAPSETPAAPVAETTWSSLEAAVIAAADPHDEIGDVSVESPDIAKSPGQTVSERIASQEPLLHTKQDNEEWGAQSLHPTPSPAALSSAPLRSPPDEASGQSVSDDSLGAAILASGLMPRTGAPQTDPLAALRRMSQSEKIALFT